VVVVDGIDSIKARQEADNKLKKIPNPDEMTEYLISTGQGELIQPDQQFTYPSGHNRRGFYMDSTLKTNIDNFLIPAVHAKWDGVGLITGMEGSSKSTNAMALAKYLDPTFPGEPLNDGTTRRHCDRVVFSPKDFMDAIDKAKPRQAIVFDEAIMGFLAGDASTDIQKSLVKKMVTIRKKQLYIFIVLPSIFLLRMYMAMFRTRYLIHYYTPDGISRGYFKFYSYESKRYLYVKGKKDFNQDATPYDFQGRATDTAGLFFDINEYENKKDGAIRNITDGKQIAKENLKNKEYILKGQRDLLVYKLYQDQVKLNPKMTLIKFAEWLEEKFGENFKFTGEGARLMIKNAQRFLNAPDPNKIKEKAKIEAMKERLGS